MPFITLKMADQIALHFEVQHSLPCANIARYPAIPCI